MPETLQKSRSPWVTGIFVFFIALVIFNIFVVRLALQSNRGYIENNPYKRGLEYQDTINKENLLSSLGITAHIDAVRLDANSVKLNLSFQPVRSDIAGVKVKALRMSDRHLDTSAELVGPENARYSAILAMPSAGLWRLEFEFRINGQVGILKRDEIMP